MYGSSKVISARWARNISKKAAEFELVRSEFEDIMEQIEARAYKGYNNLLVMQDISPVVERELNKLGYTVEENARIRW